MDVGRHVDYIIDTGIEEEYRHFVTLIYHFYAYHQKGGEPDA